MGFISSSGRFTIVVYRADKINARKGFAEDLAQLFERRKTNENLQLSAIASR
jgi:hypothetical protein